MVSINFNHVYFGWRPHTPDRPPIECSIRLCKSKPLATVDLCHQHCIDELRHLIRGYRIIAGRLEGFRQAILHLAAATPFETITQKFVSDDEFLDHIIQGTIDGTIDKLSLPEKLNKLAPPSRGPGRPRGSRNRPRPQAP